MNWIVVVILFTIITITIGFLIMNKDKLSGSTPSAPTAQTISQLISTTGFDESKVVNTKTTTDTKTGATVVTSTDSSGKKLEATTSSDGSKTDAKVTDSSGKTLGSHSSNALDTIKALAPTLLENVAAGTARDLVLVGGSKLISKVTKDVAEKGIKSTLQQGGKLVAREGTEAAMKFLGYMSFTGATAAADAAAEVGLRKAAQEAAKQSIDDALKRAGKKTLQEITDVAAREAIQRQAEAAARTATKDLVEKTARKTVQTAAEKAMVKGGTALAEKAATRGAMMAAKMGAKAGMGPVGWALMAFDVVSLALDVACCGGYCEVADTKTWEKQRDTLKGQVDALVKDANTGDDGQPDPDPVRWPIITGPFNTLDSAALQQRVIEKIKAAMADSNNTIVKATMDKLKAAIADKTVTTEDQMNDFIDANLDLDGLKFEATKNLCTELLGKSVIEDGKFAGCSWPDQAKCEASFEWGEKTFDKDKSIYSSWNKEKQECNKDPVAQNMRVVCDGAGFPFNKDTKICDLNKDYCLKKGLKWDGTNCKLEKGQEIAEMMFGTTTVRGLNAIYSADQYEPCPPGSRPAGEIAALGALAGGPMLGTYLGQTMCASDKCPDGTDRVSGLCYDPCKPGYDDKSDGITGMKVQGMCYKCPDGFKKTTAGMCHREGCDANLERGGQGTAGVGLCYPKCTDKFGPEYKDSNGMNLCLKQCPPGTRTEPLTCMRDVVVKQAASATKTCPPGWSASVAGPGGMCQQDCTDGYKKYGGLCYHPSVDTNLLVKGASKRGCDSGQRDDGTSCWEDLKTHSDPCPGKRKQGCCHGPFWEICNPVKVWSEGCGCIKKNLFDRQYCPAGYSLNAGMCYAVSKPVPQTKSLLEVGQCNDASKPEGSGGMCYQKCSDFGGSFHKSAEGLCTMDAQSTSRDPKDRGAGVPYIKDVTADQYSRQPLGISYKVFPKKRKIPFGKGPNGC